MSNVLVLVGVGLAVWLFVAVLVGLAIGRHFKRREQQPVAPPPAV